MNARKNTLRGSVRSFLPLCAVLLAAALPSARGAGLLIADGGFGGVLEIEEQTVDVTVNNGVAVTEVNQVFRNTESRQVEALYTFPVPKGASVANFSMWINDTEMVGEVLEKKRAREIYDSYKKVRRDPGLLEQTDYKTFEMRIFPIGPQARQRVRVTYYQELDPDDTWVTYVYPLATVSRKDINQRTTGTFALNLRFKSAVPIAEMESPSHPNDFVTVSHAPDFAQAGMEMQGGSLDRDVVLAFRLVRPKTGLDLIANRVPGDDGYFMLMLTPGKELDALRQGMDYVFVLDISGSMAHAGKMRVSRSSVSEFVRVLGPDDRFEVMTFNVGAKALFAELTAASDENRSRAEAFLASQEARGGTELNPALRAAMAYGNPDRALNIVVLSDGMTEQRERTALIQAANGASSHVRLFCIGVGNEVNRPLLSRLAEDAGGLAAFVSHGDNFERAAQAFRRKLTRPVATNVSLTFEGGDVYDVEPKQLPNLYHGAPVRVYGRYRKGEPVTVNLRADIAAQELKQKVVFDFPKEDDANPEIERMWASKRVDGLLRQADREGDRSAAVPEIIRLGEAYSIASEYTSFIVLENDAEYKRWSIERRNALRVERDRRAQETARKALEALRDKAAVDLGPAALENEAPALADAAAPTNNLTAGRRPRTVPVTPTRPGPRRSWDVDLPSGGGGALDPVSVGLALALGAAALAGMKGRRKDD